jgi:hypothetical protein
MALIDGAPGEVQKLTQKKLRGDHEAGSVGRQKNVYFICQAQHVTNERKVQCEAPMHCFTECIYFMNDSAPFTSVISELLLF